MKTLLMAAHRRTRQLLCEALKRRGHEVTIVEDTEAAHAALQAGGFRLAVLEADGPQGEASVACCWVRAMARDADCVILAAGRSAEPEHVQALLAAGADDYLTDLDDARRLDVRLTVAEHRLDGGALCRAGQTPSSRFLIRHCPVLHNAPCGVFRAATDGKLLDVNPVMVTALGYDSRKELLGVDLRQDVHQDPADWPRAIAQLSEGGHLQRVELGWKRKDGTPIIVQMSGRTLRDDTGAVVQIEGMIDDVTEQKRTEEVRQKAEEKFSNFVRQSAYGYAEVDAEGRILFLNRRAADIVGYLPDELVGKPFFEVLEESELARARANLQAARTQPGAEPNEYKARAKDGTARFLAVNTIPQAGDGRSIAFQCTIQDVTKRVEAEDALQRSEQRLRNVLENMPVMMNALDADGNIIVWNQECERVTGYRADEVIGNPDALSMMYPDDAYRERMLAEWLRRDNDYRDWEWEITCKDGTVRTVAWSNISKHFPVAGWAIWGIGFDVTPRRQTEEALREQVRRNALILETSMDGFYILDMEGNFLEVNPAKCAMVGYTRDELLSMNIRVLEALENPEEVGRHIEYVKNRGLHRFESKHRRKDGKLLDMELSVQHCELGEKEFLFAFTRDVTQRKRSAEELRKSEQRYRLIADNVTDMIWTATLEGLADWLARPEHDDPVQPPEQLLRAWRFTYVSPSVKRLLGYGVAEMKAMKLEDLLPPDSYSTAGAVLAEELQAERREPGRPRERSLELKHYAQDGSVRWVEVSVTLLRDRENRPSGLLGVTRNIAERKEAEEALRESETKLRGLLENLPDVVAMADRDSVIRFVNHGAPGASRQALLGSSGFDLLLPEYAQRCREAFQRTFAGHQPETLDARDVFGYWWTYRIVPMIEEGEVRNVMAICTDITEQRKAVEAVEKEQRLLRRLLDLQERDRQLIAYEIHDGFAQQLTGAKLNFEASARLRDRDPDQARKTFDAGIRLLGQGVAEARRLISGLRPPVLDEFGVLEAVHYLTCEAQDHGGPEVEFHQDVQFERLAAPLESAVFRIVQESLANACRHSQSPRIRIELVQRDDRVQLSVRDWGIGFNPAEVEEHCFGLKGIRERARLLGGKATIDTVIDQGTCITVDLPLVEPSQKGTDSEGPPSESPAPPPRHGPGRSPRNT